MAQIFTSLAFLVLPITAQRAPALFAGTDSGLIVSKDEGQTWQENWALGRRPVFALAADPFHSEVLLASTSDGIFRSADFGESWEKTEFRASFDLRSLTFDPVAQDRVYAVVRGYRDSATVWVSIDGGMNWSLPPGLPQSVTSIAFDAAANGTIYLGARYGMYKSTDSGQTWSQLSGQVTREVVAGQAPGKIARFELGVLSFSDDGANKWQKLLTPPPSVLRAPRGAEDVLMLDPSGHGIFLSHITLRGDGQDSFHACVSGVYFSFGPDDLEVYGMLTYENGQWKAVQLPVSSTCEAMVSDPASPLRAYAGGANNLHRTEDGGRTWTQVPGLEGHMTNALLLAPIGPQSPQLQ